MLFKPFASLGLLLFCLSAKAQVPEVELVANTNNDPFMPERFYQTRWLKNERDELQYRLRKEELLEADFTGQFTVLLSSSERLLHHPLFRQFGTWAIYREGNQLHYGIPTTFDKQSAFDNYFNTIVHPRTKEARVLYFFKGKESRRVKSFIQ
ncbi:MAG TPA: hypothetical protein VJ917_10655 [Saprospiraceae bacterium]|nr:hypothetical protein [Saprospiraceae bacterium]